MSIRSHFSSTNLRWGLFREARVWVALVAGASVASLIFFDLGPPLAFNDDWFYSWSVRQLVAGHGIVLFPTSAASGYLQIVWGAVITIGNPDQRLLRLSQVPFLLLAALSVYRLSRTLDASRTWSWVAAAALVCFPIYMALATTFMTDGFFLAMMIATLASSARWVKFGRERALGVLLIGLATFERQFGIILLVPLGAGLLSCAIAGRLRRSDLYYLAAAIGVALLAELGPGWFGWTTPVQAYLSATASLDPTYVLRDLYWTVGITGLLLLPFLFALWRPIPGRQLRRTASIPFVLVLAGAIFAYGLSQHNVQVFEGNYLTTRGLNPVSLIGPKELYPLWLFMFLEILAVICAAVFAVRCITEFRWRPLSAEWVLISVAPASQLLVLGISPYTFDRYFLPVIVPLLPIAAALATRASRSNAARIWAVLALAAGLVFYFVGEQDHFAWQAARDHAAQMVYQCFPANTVQAGFEANGVYVEEPEVEQTGTVIGFDPANIFGWPALLGPHDPAAALQLSNDPLDPAPGVAYNSLAPGKIVVVVRHPLPKGCKLTSPGS